MSTRGRILGRKLSHYRTPSTIIRQYKPAMKLVSDLLTKHANFAHFFAFRALILEKLEKAEEASDSALPTKFANLLGDITLDTLQTVF